MRALRPLHLSVVTETVFAEASTDSTKVSFDRTVSALRWLGTNGLRMFLQFWYARQPIFWLPKGWMPYYAEWLLSFPRAPLGSISIQAWSLACAAMILLVSDALVALTALTIGTCSAPRAKEAPMMASSEKAGKGQSKEGKKDL